VVQRFPNIKTLSAPGRPTILFTKRAILPCGCFVACGQRQDNGEAASGECPCSQAHLPLMVRFHRALVASLEQPQDRLLVEVCDELLEQTFASVA
jgi:hypothetical protein